MNIILEMENIVKTYLMGDENQIVLDNVNLTVEQGEFISVLGPSGSGKSTLMNIIGCLDVPTTGKYVLNGHDISGLDEVQLSGLRNREIGFIFQQFQLLPRLNALQNVELPLIYSGVSEKERKERAREMLVKVGLENKLENRPNQLSGGQQQRVAIARALVTQPTILLADEPTGALDQKTGVQIMQLFQELHDEGKTIIMITHDKHIAKYGSRIVRLLDGKLSVNGDAYKALMSEVNSENAAEIDAKEAHNNTAVSATDSSLKEEAVNQVLGALATYFNSESGMETAQKFLCQMGEKPQIPAQAGGGLMAEASAGQINEQGGSANV